MTLSQWAVIALLAWAHAAEAGDRETWVIAVDLWGNRSYETLELERDAATLAGTLDGAPLEGKSAGHALHFSVAPRGGPRRAFDAETLADTMRGKVTSTPTSEVRHGNVHAFTGWRVPPRPDGPPRRHEYVPTDYSNTFSADRRPVLVVWPGDTVMTTTVDSGGVDEHGDTRALYGNPQTGPFFVGSAIPGDTLIVHITRLEPNRDSADSLDGFVGRALNTSLAVQATELGKPVRWTLDRTSATARPASPSPGLRDFSVPLRPMLGGLGVAPPFGFPPLSTGDTGRFGGNMDFNEITEGSTVYLPVRQPGALLYLGDAHALQGDGETSQFALETSMRVEFRVDVVHGRAPSTPRIETATHFAALGQAGSLEDALRGATSGLIEWLQEEYHLELAECAQVIGTSVEYRVATLAGRNVGIAARLEKSRLSGLHRIARR